MSLDPFNIEFIIILVSLGLLFSFLCTIVGEGGGAFYVSFMCIFLFLPINISIDTSNFIILITSAPAFIMYLRNNRTNTRLTIAFSFFSILGSLISTILLIFITIEKIFLNLLFCILLFFIGINMVYKAFKDKRNIESENQINKFFDDTFLDNYNYKNNMKQGIPLFFFAGFMSNLLGIGGGIVNTPALNIVLNFPIHYATAVSISMVFITAIFNSFSKIIFGNINYLVGFLIGLVSIIGSSLGAKYSNKIPKFHLKFIVGFLLLFIGFRMIIQI